VPRPSPTGVGSYKKAIPCMQLKISRGRINQRRTFKDRHLHMVHRRWRVKPRPPLITQAKMMQRHPGRDGSRPSQRHANRGRRSTGACAVAGAERAVVGSTSGQPRDRDRAADRLAEPKNNRTGGRRAEGSLTGLSAGGFVTGDGRTTVKCGWSEGQADTGAVTVWRGCTDGRRTWNSHGCRTGATATGEQTQQHPACANDLSASTKILKDHENPDLHPRHIWKKYPWNYK